MSKQRKRILFLSIALAIPLSFFLLRVDFERNATLAYVLHIFLFVFFFAVLVSNQQYEEDPVAKIERVVSSVFCSYIFIIQMVYAPVAGYIFGTMIRQKIFLTDLLALSLFLLFVFLFGVLSVILSRNARFDFLSQWIFFNNSTTYFILRGLFLPAILLAVFLYWQKPFIIITTT